MCLHVDEARQKVSKNRPGIHVNSWDGGPFLDLGFLVLQEGIIGVY